MNILVVGTPHARSGSWTMRGVQLGAAIGARVTTEPVARDWAWADRIILVKRAGHVWAAQAQAANVPLVWDALDCWRQPGENGVGEPQARVLFRRQIQALRPTLTLGATEAQAAACGGVCVPHHSWAGLTPTPARPTVSTIAYEGNPAYLGRWRDALQRACRSRGWTFVVNPPDLRTADLLVSFRDGRWDGWMCREWKSGVKVVNAIAAGRPLITQDSAAVRELQPAGSVIARLADLAPALDAWQDSAPRQAVVDASIARAAAFTVEAIAAQYLTVLAGKRRLRNHDHSHHRSPDRVHDGQQFAGRAAGTSHAGVREGAPETPGGRDE